MPEFFDARATMAQWVGLGASGDPVPSAEVDTAVVSESLAEHPSSPTPTPGRGQLIGRYMVLDPIGEGGMGTIVAAYDPELDRRVALKLIRTRPNADPEGPLRLLREAQAIARLSHPNVVAVYDAGHVDGRVFIAMELVRGKTLREWLSAEARSQASILGALRQAARGLAAAHEAGLVHRDFKPSNVLVGEDGRVRVLDFGLARASASDEPAPHESPDRPLLDTPLTQAGTVMGTPAYMAPEQHGGRVVDARADQFAFCVVAFEAIYGVRPFEGETVDERLDSILSEKIRTTGRRPVPRWIRAVLAKGLRAAPEDRHPSMVVLLRQLDRDPAQLWRRAFLAVGALALVGGVLAWPTDAGGPNEVCGGAELEMSQIWNEDRREVIRARFSSSSLPAASLLYEGVAKRIDSWSEDWQRVHHEACVATRIRKERSEDLLDRQMMCLDSQGSDLDAVLELLETADDAVVTRSTTMVAGLASPSTCSNLAVHRSLAPMPEGEIARERLAGVNQQIARGKALRRAGKQEDAGELVEQLIADAKLAGWDPALARASVLYGQVLSDRGEYETAEEALNQGLAAADRGRDDLTRAQAGAVLAFVRGHQRADTEEALRLLDQAAAALERAGGDPAHEALILLTRGIVEDDAGRHARARRAYEAALELAREVLSEDHPVHLAILSNLAITLALEGDIEGGLHLQNEILKLQVRSLGENHPDLIGTMTNIGNNHGRRRDFAAAAQWHRRAAELAARVLPTPGPSHVEALGNLGGALTELQRWDEARQALTRAREIVAHGDPHDHRSLAMDGMLAQLDHAEGNLSAARAGLEDLVRRGEDVYGAQHPFVAQVLVSLGQTQLDAGDREVARTTLERALSIYEAAEVSAPVAFASAEFALAEALGDLEAERSRARRLAARARVRLTDLGDTTQAEVQEVDGWLASHGGPLAQSELPQPASIKPPAG